MKVGKFFTLQEFTVSQTATRRGIPNDPPEDVIDSIRALCSKVLDPLRRKLGKPIVVSSGYRSPELNEAIGGAASSQHCKGEAADIICPGVEVSDLVNAIREMDLPFDQLIHEGTWVHVSYSKRNRRQVLKARFGPIGVTYGPLN
jgi:hypothetical protein